MEQFPSPDCPGQFPPGVEELVFFHCLNQTDRRGILRYVIIKVFGTKLEVYLSLWRVDYKGIVGRRVKCDPVPLSHFSQAEDVGHSLVVKPNFTV